MGRDPLTENVIGCAIEVHRCLGPGLLESAYEQCLARELALQPIEFQLPAPVESKGVGLDCGYNIDMLVEQRLIPEWKSVEVVLGIHQAQLPSCMKWAGFPAGPLLNFHVGRLRDGMRRFGRFRR